jgi:adenine-specific DNA-methyltransferase
MSNLSKVNREKMLKFLDELRQQQNDDESLKAINEIENSLTEKKYGLVWEEHEERVDKELKTKIPVFTEVEDKEIVMDKEKPYNFLIEGDNLHSLYLLKKTHKEKIDVIYIDPPYNTESKDFKYNDDYVDKLDGYPHSKWISFMNNRLKIARSLLKNDGCIMISINENEIFVLKLLMDEIFGQDNYLTTITIKVRHNDRILKGDKDFHEVTEYLLFYRKSKDFKIKKRKEDNTSLSNYKFKILELTNKPQETIIDGKIVHIFKPNEYKIETIDPSINGLKKISIRGSIKEGNSSGRFFMKNFEQLIKSQSGYLYKVFEMGADSLGYRYFRNPLEKEKRVNGDYFQGIPINHSNFKYIPYPNYADFVDYFNTVGYEGGIEFRNGKKPVEFLKYCLMLAGINDNKQAIVLDFFAGSGSTLEAVQQINKSDSGSRKVILCTNNDVGPQQQESYRKSKGLTPTEFKKILLSPNEDWINFMDKNGICHSITYPRVRNVSKGYSYIQSKKRIFIDGIPFNLKYYKTDYINRYGEEELYISDELMDHIKEMVQLENHIKIDNEKYIILYKENDVHKLIQDKDRMNKCKRIYKPSYILFNTEQLKEINKREIEVITIPEYYFASELKEIGEL